MSAVRSFPLGSARPYVQFMPATNVEGGSGTHVTLAGKRFGASP